MVEFNGRTADLDVLSRVIDDIEGGAGATRGRAVIVTGRRRVGKSRLVQEFCDRAQLPYVVFQATRGRNPVAERADFTAALAASGLPGAEAVAGLQAGESLTAAGLAGEWEVSRRTAARILRTAREQLQ